MQLSSHQPTFPPKLSPTRNFLSTRTKRKKRKLEEIMTLVSTLWLHREIARPGRLKAVSELDSLVLFSFRSLFSCFANYYTLLSSTFALVLSKSQTGETRQNTKRCKFRQKSKERLIEVHFYIKRFLILVLKPVIYLCSPRDLPTGPYLVPL